MKTLIFEQWQGGHYFDYLECLVPKLAEISDEVVVAVTGSAASSPLFTQQLGHLREIPNVRLDVESAIPKGSSPIAARFDLVRNLVGAIERSRPDYVFLPSADEHLWTLPLKALFGAGRALRSLHVEAVIHYKAYTATATPRERLVSAAQSQLLKSGAFSQLNFANCLQYEEAVARELPLTRIARAAGSPVPQPPRINRRAARSALGLDPAGRLLGMVGGLDKRKAVPATLAAFRAARLPRGDRLLVAGKLAAEYSELIRAQYADLVRDGSLIVLDRYLTSEEVANGFAALDVHCSVYTRFSGLSSLMLKSIAAGVPVLVHDHPGWTRAIVRRFAVGDVVDAANIEDFARGMRATLEGSGSGVETEAVRRLMRFHSVENFTEGIAERLIVHAGKRPPAPVAQWSWVLESLPPERRTLL